MSGASLSRILLVAREGTLRGLLERLLTARGHVVIDGGSGVDTVALLGSEDPVDLVVCERTGPGLDEVALFEEIRHHPDHGLVPILALPPADPECTARALEAGVDDCLAKPFHPTEFLTRVERLATRPAG
ncbi:response regulator transcription factor [Streptomyces sp. NPDC085524]|uniref:response regulator transcription factor n=1 Tax=Streptomyces sp. NPDC085524 TaxID=3365728 RepID=UPI0037D828A3